MSDENKIDALNQLWQQQQVPRPDQQDLLKRWRKMRWQQWVYLVADVLVMIATGGLLWYAYHWFAPLMQGILVMVWVGCIAFTIYISWLRRHALVNWQTDTGQYLQLISKQLANNARIAGISGKFALYGVPFNYLFHFAHAWQNDTTLPLFMRKMLWLTAILLVVVAPLWWWFNRREARFKQELANIQAISGSDLSTPVHSVD